MHLFASPQATFFLVDPLPPAKFECRREKATSTSLNVWWTPSPGKVTEYGVQLFDDKQKIQDIKIPELTSRNEHTFFNLTAGNKYNIAITAFAGDKHSSTVYTNGSTGNIYINTYVHIYIGSWIIHNIC